jgi:hypothetical protein
MSGLNLYQDQKVKEEQYKDMVREVERYRLVKAVSPSGSSRLQKVVAALRKVMGGTPQQLPSLGSTEQAPI